MVYASVLLHLSASVSKLRSIDDSPLDEDDEDEDEDEDDEDDEEEDEDDEEDEGRWAEITQESPHFSQFWQTTLAEGVAWYNESPGYKSKRWRNWASK